MPGIGDFAAMFSEVFGPVRIVERIEGVRVLPLLTEDVRDHFKWKRNRRGR